MSDFRSISDKPRNSYYMGDDKFMVEFYNGEWCYGVDSIIIAEYDIPSDRWELLCKSQSLDTSDGAIGFHKCDSIGIYDRWKYITSAKEEYSRSRKNGCVTSVFGTEENVSDSVFGNGKDTILSSLIKIYGNNDNRRIAEISNLYLDNLMGLILKLDSKYTERHINK